VTTNEERRQHLVAACRSLGNGGRIFLFADERALAQGDILSSEWVNGRGEPVRLLDGLSRLV
jgi:hypothetical protein